MHHNPLVSICIPTYNRSAFLTEAISSCIEQDYRPLEILVGDDSPTVKTKANMEAIPADNYLRIRYFAHRRRLGQAGNLNHLMSNVNGEYFIILHDDDMLVHGSTSMLQRILIANPDVIGVFGLQYIVDKDGNVLHDRTDALNNYCGRTPDKEGAQQSIMAAALKRQFPNDGFMLRRIVAERVKYRQVYMVGTGCDFDFGIQIAKTFPNQRFFFVNQYTSKYRISDWQISSRPIRAPMLSVLLDLHVDKRDREHLTKIIRIFAIRSVYEAIMGNDKASARRIFFSPSFPARQRFSLKGLAFFLAMFLPVSSPTTWRFICIIARKPTRIPGNIGSVLIDGRYEESWRIASCTPYPRPRETSADGNRRG